MTVTGLILWGTCIFCIVIWLWQALNEAKFKKNLVLGVTLPFEAHQDPQVLHIIAQYKKFQWIAAAILTLLCIAGALIPDLGLSMSLWSIFFLICILVPSVIVALANYQLKQIKAQKGWICKENQLIRVDLSTLSAGKKASFVSYLPPLILCFGFILFDQKFLFLHCIDFCVVLFCFFSARFLYRNKAETVDGNSQLTRTLSKLRRKRWNWIWLLCAYSTAVGISFCSFFARYRSGIAVFCSVLILLAFCFIILFLEMQMRHLQEKLTADSGKDWYVDDDEHWPFGLFYYNSNDSHILINQRVGTGSTFNLATKTGKFFIVFSLFVLLLIPVIMIPIANMDKTPILLTVTDAEIICESGRTNYAVSMDDIEEIQLSDTLPKSMFRVWGTGMPHLISGNFTAEGMDAVTVLADPTAPPYLIIKKTSGSYLLFGTRDPEQTAQIFEEITALTAAS